MKNKQATIIASALLACLGILCVAYFLKTRQSKEFTITRGDSTIVEQTDGARESSSGFQTGWNGPRGKAPELDEDGNPVEGTGEDVGLVDGTSDDELLLLTGEKDGGTTDTLPLLADGPLEPGMIGINSLGQKVMIGPDGEEIVMDEGVNEGQDLTGVDDDDIPKIDAGVYGQVLRGDRPVNDARLRLEGVSNGYRRDLPSDGDGLFRFAVPGTGDYILYLHSPSSTSSMRTLIVVEEGDWFKEVFNVPDLEPATGLVVDVGTKEGIVNAEIVVSRQGTHMGGARSSDGGRFTLIPLDEGTYTAEAKASGYPKKEFSFTIFENGPVEELYFELESSPIVGRLYYQNGQPVSNGIVSLFGTGGLWNDPYESSWMNTSSDGSFTLAIPNIDSEMGFMVGGFKEGYLPAYSQVINRDGEIPPVVDVTLKNGFEITARVIDEAENEVSDAVVEISEGFFETGNLYRRFNQKYPSAVSDSSGRVSISPVEAGDLVLSVSSEGYTPGAFDFSISGSKDLGDLVLDGGETVGEISGFIVDENLAPIIGMNIDAQNLTGDGSGSAVSDSKGAFKIDELPEGDYLLTLAGSTLRGNLWIPLSYKSPFARTGDPDLYLIFDLDHQVEVKVVDADGEPIKNFTAGVMVDYIGGTGPGGKKELIHMAYNRTIQTSDGITVLDNLISGSGTLTINVSGFGTNQVDITVPVDGTGDAGKVFVFKGADVDGQVVSSPGSDPVSGVEVQAVPPRGSSLDHPLNTLTFRTVTDSSGDFKLKGLPEGSTDFVFRKQGLKEIFLRNKMLEPEQLLDLGDVEMLTGAILSGVAYDPDHKPITDIVIYVNNQVIYTDMQGRFRCDTLPEGSHQLRATDQQHRYDSVFMPVNLTAGEEAQIEVQFLEQSVDPTVTPEPTISE